MRMVIVAGLLMIALLCAVLSSIGPRDPGWIAARDNVGAVDAPAKRTREPPGPG